MNKTKNRRMLENAGKDNRGNLQCGGGGVGGGGGASHLLKNWKTMHDEEKNQSEAGRAM